MSVTQVLGNPRIGGLRRATRNVFAVISRALYAGLDRLARTTPDLPPETTRFPLF